MSHPAPKSRSLLLFCPASHGGIPDYAHEQAKALSELGWQVTMLCPRDYPHQATGYLLDRGLPLQTPQSRFRPIRILQLVRLLLGNMAILAGRIEAGRPSLVLLASYSEYLAPLWAWRLRRLARAGTVFAAVAHDPVRDFVVGPLWWHRWSVSEGYSFLKQVFVHEEIQLDTGSRQMAVRTTVIPHGPFSFPAPSQAQGTVRAAMGIPAGVPLFLSFGHLRDGKNLKLILEAMRSVPDAWLLCAGTEAGGGHIKSAGYRALAESFGVAGRCIWRIGFVSPEEVGNLFGAADFIILAYQASFRSASGVLNLAVQYRRPVVVSCGESNLASAVIRYNLGVRIAADDPAQIEWGMRRISAEPIRPRWQEYELENSWRTNAMLVSQALGESAPLQP